MKTLSVATSVLALAMTFSATAGFANSECTEDCEPPPPPPECISDCEPVKGNNGWGNGPDSTNAGSFSGGTAITKSVNGLGVDKFDGKFEGR